MNEDEKQKAREELRFLHPIRLWPGVSVARSKMSIARRKTVALRERFNEHFERTYTNRFELIAVWHGVLRARYEYVGRGGDNGTEEGAPVPQKLIRAGSAYALLGSSAPRCGSKHLRTMRSR